MSGHVRDTCMKFLGINKCKSYMLATCRKCFRINNVSFSSTKLLLTKNYSEKIIFVKITNFTRNSLKESLFPGDFESAKCLKNYDK